MRIPTFKEMRERRLGFNFCSLGIFVLPTFPYGLLLDHVPAATLQRDAAGLLLAGATGASLGNAQFKTATLAYKPIALFHVCAVCHLISSFHLLREATRPSRNRSTRELQSDFLFIIIFFRLHFQIDTSFTDP